LFDYVNSLINVRRKFCATKGMDDVEAWESSENKERETQSERNRKV
jgi:hypothetical protein